MNRLGNHSAVAEAVSFSGKELSLRTLFLHAWDLADDGVEHVFGEARESGLNALTLAATYHAGWFIHPQNRNHRAYMTEGSVSYFRVQDSLWKNVKLRPRLAALSQQTDWFAEAGKKAAEFDLNLISWTVGCHNSHLGTIYPELTQQNVYGDRLPHTLCPAQPHVREYLLTLCRDLARNHPLWAIQLEAFGWMGFVHGHHHERDLVGLTSLEQELMGLCVCPACTSDAMKAGVEMTAVKQVIKTTLDTAFREAPTRPANHPATMAELERTCPEVEKFNAWRRKFLVSLITDIKTQALSETTCRLFLQTGFDPELEKVVDGFSCFAFGTAPAETQRICREATQTLPQNWNALLQCCVQLGMGIPQSEQQFREIIEAVGQGGCNGIAFYNRSEAPPKMLGWLKEIGTARWRSSTAKSHRLVQSVS